MSQICVTETKKSSRETKRNKEKSEAGTRKVFLANEISGFWAELIHRVSKVWKLDIFKVPRYNDNGGRKLLYIYDLNVV
jgi:hypothetical protein